jgi:hypothetical protein
MKVDMQSDSGIVYLKNILKEICTTYDVPYMHIGADEVKIVNKNFIPEISAYIESYGKKLIGWQPGGNFTNNTIRQLWMDDNAHKTDLSELQLIDSRHLYLNHLDPLESVVTIYNRQIGKVDAQNKNVLGGTICMWHDRAIANEIDILQMNPVYPGMLAFAERSWQGGGKVDWVANISDGDVQGFSSFEKRLLDNKKQYFTNLSFPYVQQTSLQWNLIGPFKNEGNLTKIFWPEQNPSKDKMAKGVVKKTTGGTIVLRHWWAPLIKGAIDVPTDSSTWYAQTNIWSDEAKQTPCWIGFYNISRSQASDSPAENTWNNIGNTVWVNGKKVEPPNWQRKGQIGNLEIPLTDEGYEYRNPTIIYLEKGWNNILIKAPMGSFKSTNWANPKKWMFTFVPL